MINSRNLMMFRIKVKKGVLKKMRIENIRNFGIQRCNCEAKGIPINRDVGRIFLTDGAY